MRCHPEPRRRRGTSQLQIEPPKKDRAPTDVDALPSAEAIDRLRGPSPSARLGMTAYFFSVSSR